MPLLEVTDLKTYFRTDDGVVRAVDGVSFSIDKGQTLGIVGESGSGKSVTCLTIMGLNPRRSAMMSGQALWKGEDLLTASPRRLREIRGSEIAMIFQDPMTSLNPVHKIGEQLAEAMRLHEDVSRKTARARALELLKAVGIPRPRRCRRDCGRRRRHVRRRGCGEGRRRADLQEAPPPVHVGADGLAAAPRRGRRAPRADPGPAAVDAEPADRLPLPSALPVRDADLQGSRSRPRAGLRRSGPSPVLPSGRRDQEPRG